MKKINLIGQKFGRLTVLSEIEERKNKQIYWHCKCDCGNECDAMGGHLKRGKIQSCGCLQKERSSESHSKNLTNQRFGKLVALYPLPERSSDGKIIWDCECDCGKHHQVASSFLINGHVKSCGCLTDLTNQRFGKLVALYPLPERKNRYIVWHCKCDCGNEKDIISTHLITNIITHCGCATTKSLGEDKIAEILKQNQILFEQQKTFNTCRFPDTNALAFFDFYLLEYNILIEYDGIQHFQSEGGWNTKEHLTYTQNHDEYKNQWCKDNNITLIRIPYYDFDNITTILQDIINNV